MSITQDHVNTALAVVHDLQRRVFFNKLASLNVVPSDDQDRETLWKLGGKVLQAAPAHSDQSRTAKQTSFDVLGNLISPVANDGYSMEAHKLVEDYSENVTLMKAAHILLAVNNA